MVDLTPAGVNDLYTGTTRDWPDEIWYWCRRHEQAHQVGEPCRAKITGGGASAWVAPGFCIDIGPFMSEREANRLAGNTADSSTWIFEPLGMEVEQ